MCLSQSTNRRWMRALYNVMYGSQAWILLGLAGLFTAISTLIKRIKDPQRPGERVHLPTKLVVRESSDKNAASGGF